MLCILPVKRTAIIVVIVAFIIAVYVSTNLEGISTTSLNSVLEEFYDMHTFITRTNCLWKGPLLHVWNMEVSAFGTSSRRGIV